MKKIIITLPRSGANGPGAPVPAAGARRAKQQLSEGWQRVGNFREHRFPAHAHGRRRNAGLFWHRGQAGRRPCAFLAHFPASPSCQSVFCVCVPMLVVCPCSWRPCCPRRGAPAAAAANARVGTLPSADPPSTCPWTPAAWAPFPCPLGGRGARAGNPPPPLQRAATAETRTKRRTRRGGHKGRRINRSRKSRDRGRLQGQHLRLPRGYLPRRGVFFCSVDCFLSLSVFIIARLHPFQ